MKQKQFIMLLLTSSILIACGNEKNEDAQQSKAQVEESKASTSKAVENNPTSELSAKEQLTKKWTGPYQGVPSFDKVSIDGLADALDEAMALNLAEIDEIANNPEPPTFENTIVAMEKTGEVLDRVLVYRGIWSANMSSPEFRKIQAEMAPKLSAFTSKIRQNTKLFDRISAIYDGEEVKTLRDDQKRLVLLTYNSFARNGSTLTGDAKTRYAEINLELSKLYTKFANNVLSDEESYVLYLNDKQLGGLPQSVINSAASAAKDRDHEGEYLSLIHI